MGMATSKIGKKYTIVIPQEIRRKIPVREGETIVWEVEDEKMVIKPASFMRLAGIVKSSSLTSDREVKESLEKEIERDIKEAFK